MKRKLKYLYILGALAAFNPTPAFCNSGIIEHGTIHAIQNSAANTSAGVSISYQSGTSPGLSFTRESNKGDFFFDASRADDFEGIAIASVAEDGRDNSVLPNAGGPAGIRYATAGVARSGIANDYYISLHEIASTPTEMNSNVAFGWFSKAHWICGLALNSADDGDITSVETSSSIQLGDELTKVSTGRYNLDLSGSGASSSQGILLVGSAANQPVFAMSEANADGTFEIYSHTNEGNGSSYESESFSFVYVPKSYAQNQTLGVVALGRVRSDGAVQAGAGNFTIAKGNTGEWRLQIPGHAPDSGTLLISAEGGGVNTLDNVVAYRWDESDSSYIISSRDLPALDLQDGNSAAEEMFSFVFIASHMVNTTDEVSPVAGVPSTIVPLRHAVETARNGTRITFHPSMSGRTVLLNQIKGPLIISKKLAIDASLLNEQVVVDASSSANDLSNAIQCMKVTEQGFAVLNQLKLTNGGTSGIGGCLANAGSVELVDCTISNGYASIGGGGIASTGLLRAERCTFNDNLSSFGGAVYSNSDVSSPSLRLETCTFSRNRADDTGGAILNINGEAVIVHSTIVDNEAGLDAGGIFCAGTATGFTSLSASIIARNGFVDLKNGETAKPFELLSKCLIGNPGTVSVPGGSHIVNNRFPLLLAPLGDFGGPTETMPPLIGSLALDTGEQFPLTDQRRTPAALDGDRNGISRPDIGATEAYSPILVNTAVDENDPLSSPNVNTSLREAMAIAAVTHQHSIVIDPLIAGETMTSVHGPLQSNLSLSISSPSDLFTISFGSNGDDQLDANESHGFVLGEGASQSSTYFLKGLHVRDGYSTQSGGLIRAFGETVLSDMELTHGRIDGNQLCGGALFVDGNLLLVDSTVSSNLIHGNFARGAGICVQNGNLEIFDTRISENQITGDNALGGGAYIIGNGNLEIEYVTFRGNRLAGLTCGGAGIGISASGELSAQFVTFSENIIEGDFGYGGGLMNGSFSEIHLEEVEFKQNRILGQAATGAGMESTGTPTIKTALFLENAALGAEASGGGLHTRFGATISESAIIRNRADGMSGTGATYGGGIRSGSDLHMTNVTIAYNKAESSGGSANTFGGGVYAENGLLIHCTITENEANAGGSGITTNTSELFGMHIAASIVAGNRGSGDLEAENFSNFLSLGYNHIGNGDNEAFVDGIFAHSTVSLAPLDEQYFVMIPLPGSGLINEATLVTAPQPDIDQRKIAREDTPDIGAAEWVLNWDLASVWNLDNDNDGKSLGLELAIGSSDSESERSPQDPCFDTGANGVIEFTFGVNHSVATAIDWVVLRSEDLETYTEVFRYGGTDPNAPGTGAAAISYTLNGDQLTMTDATFSGGNSGARVFYRLVAEQLPQE